MLNLPDPEVLIFDCFGVLLDFDEQLLLARLHDDQSSLPDAFDIHGVVAEKDLITGKKTLEEVHDCLVETLGLRLDYRAFARAWTQPYSWPLEGMAELIHSLAGNYTLLLLSNIDADYFRSIRPMHPEMNEFQELLLSCDLGMAKPDPEIFRYACSVASTDPELCLFIDDSLKNVDAAQQVGMQTYWFKGLTELKNELIRRKIRGVSAS
jgi:FMN phosphatase YigB (HAD superfamily)